MILAIDCGNSRMKWALGEPPPRGQLTAWRERGAVALEDIQDGSPPWSREGAPRRVLISHVADEVAREHLVRLTEGLGVPVEWTVSNVQRCGVANRYVDPARLGVDRWAAMIGARNLISGPCLVVMAGTATTIDHMDEDGVFQGGVILPGIELMKRALAGGTSGLPYVQGNFMAAPRNTADAIETGCLNAQLGAIERMAKGFNSGVTCLLSGGDAPRIARCLTMTHRLIDNLVLEGLAVMGREG